MVIFDGGISDTGFVFLACSWLDVRSWSILCTKLTCYDVLLLILYLRFGFYWVELMRVYLYACFLCHGFVWKGAHQVFDVISKPRNWSCLHDFLASEFIWNVACHVFDKIFELSFSLKVDIFWIRFMPNKCLMILPTYVKLIAWEGIYLEALIWNIHGMVPTCGFNLAHGGRLIDALACVYSWHCLGMGDSMVCHVGRFYWA
jgi:hypothetical protein